MPIKKDTKKGKKMKNVKASQTSNSLQDDSIGSFFETKLNKQVRNLLFCLIQYIDTININLFPIHVFVSIWRIIQFIGPCFAANYPNIWVKGSSYGKFMSIISIFFHIIPPSVRSQSAVIIEFIYFAIILLSAIILFSSAICFQKNARLPTWIPYFFSIFINGILILLTSVVTQISGESLGRLFHHSTFYNETIEIIGFVFSFLSLLLYIYFMVRYETVSITFKPFSLMTIFPMPQIYFASSSLLITFITAIASQISKTPRIILTFIGIVLYFLTIFIIFLPCGIISSLYKNLIFSSCITSGCFLLVMCIYDIADRSSSLVELFIFILFFIVFYFVSVIIFRRISTKRLIFIEEKGENVDNYKSLNHFFNIVVFAFEHSHPLLSEWDIFKTAVDRFSGYVDFWFLFAKLVAIYPDESHLLSHIIFSIQSNHLKNYITRQIKAQAKIVLTQREGLLSPELKVRLTKSSRQVQLTKRKLRHVWDIAIQSNLREMDSVIHAAYISVTKAQSNYQHILTQYPNNRFVAAAYSKFVLNVIGDQQLYHEWTEKIRSLQRGILIQPDRPNMLGNHAYPILPYYDKDASSKPQVFLELTANDSAADDLAAELDTSQFVKLNEQISIIHDQIRKLSIPEINCIIIWSTVLYFLIILIPSMALLIYVQSFFEYLTDPLEYMNHLSILRTSAFTLPIFGHHYVCENFNLSDGPFFPPPDFSNITLDSFNGANNTYDQLLYLITLTSSSVEAVSQFSHWAINNPQVNSIHRIVFEPTIPYVHYTDTGRIVFYNVSLQTALMETTMLVTQLINLPASPDLFSTTFMTNPIYNAKTIVDYVESALVTLYEYFTQKYKDIDNISFFALFVLSIVYIGAILGFLIYQIKKLNDTNLKVYQCLTALPKNVVSKISEKFKFMEKDDDFSEEEDENGNKQDENILKIFSSASDITLTKSHEKNVYVILNVIFIICSVVIIILIARLFPTISYQLSINAPHLDYILGTCAHLFGGIGSLHFMVTSLYNFVNPLVSWQDFANRTTYRMNMFMNYLHLVQYGGHDLNVAPFMGYANVYQNAMQHFSCPDDKAVPTTFAEAISCFSIDVDAHLVEPFIVSLVEPVVIDNETYTIDHLSPVVNELWTLGVKLYDKLFFPMFNEIVSDTKAIIESEIPIYRTVVILLLIICFFVLLCIYYEAHVSNERIKFALSLLLHVDPNIVLDTEKVMNVLSGDFDDRVSDTSIQNNGYFDTIVNRIHDSVIIMDDRFTIETGNRSTERIFHQPLESILGINGRSFFLSSSFGSNLSNLFNEINSNASEDVEYLIDDDKYYLRMKLSHYNNNYVLIARDITQSVLYKKLIHDEKEKSDNLLASILPKSLIPRVQNGEENISFSVQSATILFLDIVSFTPWCAANTAQMIMSTLNIMFRELDARLVRHSTITKIKCIGDCYMAAGGIFVEVNQPAVHAKEVVEFGLEAIQALDYINEKYKLTLQIRVGVNTGGPLVAGVFGTLKPTFEILGPAINMAQQMEHHGVPMKVHISRTTYELVYGGNFIIKERGQIEIKNGKVATYLVCGKHT